MKPNTWYMLGIFSMILYSGFIVAMSMIAVSIIISTETDTKFESAVLLLITSCATSCVLIPMHMLVQDAKPKRPLTH